MIRQDDDVVIPRYLARNLLENFMRDICKNCYCADWVDGNEYALWNLAIEAGGDYGQGEVSVNQADEMLILANCLQEWLMFDPKSEDLVPVDLSKWKDLAAARNAPTRS